MPVLPVYIDVFSPPLPSTGRAYDFGAAVQKVIHATPDDFRIAFLATGGFSHSPRVWTDGAPEHDEFLQCMKRYLTKGRHVAKEDPQLYSDLTRYEIEMPVKMQWPLRTQHPLVNAHWDRDIIELFGLGDVATLREMSLDDIEKGGGSTGRS